MNCLTMYLNHTIIFWVLILMYVAAGGLCISAVAKDFVHIANAKQEACFWGSQKNQPWVAVLIGSLCGFPPGLFIFYIVKWTVRSIINGFRSWKLWLFFLANFLFFGLAVVVALDDLLDKKKKKSSSLEKICVDMAVASCIAIIQLTMIPAYFTSCACVRKLSLSKLASVQRTNDRSDYDKPEELRDPMDFDKSLLSDFTSKMSVTGVTEESRPSHPGSYNLLFAMEQNGNQSQRRGLTGGDKISQINIYPHISVRSDKSSTEPSPYYARTSILDSPTDATCKDEADSKTGSLQSPSRC